jgi:hypothetical protein
MMAVCGALSMSESDFASAGDDAKHLVKLCRTGRLYELEKWIADGKPIELPGGKCGTLLRVAVETGFHSLIELITKHEKHQSSKNAALLDAVSLRRLDFVQLLVENGAEARSVPFADVLMCWDPKIIRFFMDHGADLVGGAPFAVAFGQKIRTALRPFMESKREHPELVGQLEDQADCALRHFSYKGDLKWVSLMLWAGGEARSLGPSLEYTNDPECFTTALKEASYSGNVEVLKKLKPDAARDNLSELLHCVAVSGHVDAIRYFLEIGAQANDKPDGGSSALDTALRGLSFARIDAYGSKRLKSRYDVSRALDCVRALLGHGAVWNPGNTYEMNSLRRTLLECEPDVTIDLLQMFRKHNACPAERVHRLLGTPGMEEHLKPKKDALLRLGIHLDTRLNARRQPQPRRP